MTNHHRQQHDRNPSSAYSHDHPHQSEPYPPYSPRDHESQFHRRRDGRRKDRRNRQQTQELGYGGGIRSSSPSDFASRTNHSYQRSTAYRPSNIDPPPLRHPEQSYHNQPYRHEIRNPRDPSAKSNRYNGGDPYSQARARLTEHSLSKLNTPSPPLSPVPLHNEPLLDSPHHRTPEHHFSGPYKPISSALSPVKPPSLRPTPKSVSSPLVPKLPGEARISATSFRTSTNTRKVDLSIPSNGVIAPAPTSNRQTQHDRRPRRTLSIEKNFRHEESRFSGQRTQRGMTRPLEISAIARPVTHASEKAPEITTSNEQTQQNGSLSTRNFESNQTHVKKIGREMGNSPEKAERSYKQFPAPGKTESSIQNLHKIFKKVPARVPKVPDDENSSARSMPANAERSDGNGIQLKEEGRRFEARQSQRKLTLLRSVPAPPRKSTLEDTPQSRAAAAAIQRAHQGEHTGTEQQDDSRSPKGSDSPMYTKSEPPSDSEARTTTNLSDHGGRARRQILDSSMAKLNIVVGKESYSVSEEVHGQKDAVQGNIRQAYPNGKRRHRFLRGGNRGPETAKRRASEFSEPRETRAKRIRPSLQPETVNADDTTVLRRSRRCQPFSPTKTWETTKFEEDRVLALFLEQLQGQPMLLRLSFLGMSDGDFRTTLETWKGEKGLPEPDQRHLELNNNRIRHVTDEMCSRISALRVVSLNLSCNLLTAIGAKIGLSVKLKFLDVSRNRLSSLPQELCDLTKLEVLNMSHNEVSRLPSGLCRLKRLEVLSLAWNKLEVLPEDVAAEGAMLSDLDLSHNESFHFFPRCAEHWTKLEVLHMPSTTIYKSLSRKEHRLRPAALVKELAGRKQDMSGSRRLGLRPRSS